MLAIKGKERGRVLDTSVGYERRLALLDERLSRAADVIAFGEAEALRAEVVAGRMAHPFLAPAFIADELGHALTFFRVEGLSRIFVLDQNEANDSLLRRIKARGLTGVASEPVWSSASGPRDINLYAV